MTDRIVRRPAPEGPETDPGATPDPADVSARADIGTHDIPISASGASGDGANDDDDRDDDKIGWPANFEAEGCLVCPRCRCRTFRDNYSPIMGYHDPEKPWQTHLLLSANSSMCLRCRAIVRHPTPAEVWHPSEVDERRPGPKKAITATVAEI